MEIYVMRHGTTQWNKLKKLQGRSDIPLDEDGRELARNCRDGMKHIHFDKCYSSPLKRAYETAEIILEGRDILIICDERLTEVSFGSFEGRSNEGTGPRGNAGRDAAAAAVSGGSGTACAETCFTAALPVSDFSTPPGGEPVEALLSRTKAFYEELISNPENEKLTILLSMHGASGRALMLNAWGGTSFWHGCVPKNCTCCIVKLKEGIIQEIVQDAVFYHGSVEDYF